VGWLVFRNWMQLTFTKKIMDALKLPSTFTYNDYADALDASLGKFSFKRHNEVA